MGKYLGITVCNSCSKPLNQRQIKHGAKYCGVECRGLDYKKKRSEAYHTKNVGSYSPTRQGHNSAITGAISEHRVIVDLLLNGYEVYRAINSRSSCDFAVLRNGELKKVEVTTGHYSQSGRLIYPKHLKERYDLLAVAMPDTIIYLFPNGESALTT